MDLSKISATLEHGRFYSGKLKLFVKFTIILLIIIVLSGTIILAFMWGELRIAGAVCVIIGIVLMCVFAIYFTYVLYCNRDIEKIVLNCLKDAVLVDAKIQDISASMEMRVYNGAKVQITFLYNGKKYTRISGSSKNEHKKTNGYDKVFWKYTGRTVQVLYSPAEDQILFLK